MIEGIHNSNTTLVKVKFLDFVNGNKVEFNSNTTLVKVKCLFCKISML